MIGLYNNFSKIGYEVMRFEKIMFLLDYGLILYKLGQDLNKVSLVYFRPRLFINSPTKLKSLNFQR